MKSNRPSSHFIADALGLDFLNAIAPPPHSKIKAIVTGDDLMAWLVTADLASVADMEEVQAIAAPGTLDVVASRARALGEWFRGFVYEHQGKPLPVAAIERLEPLNRVLEQDCRFGQVDIRPFVRGRKPPSGLTLRSRRQWRSPESLLLPIAQVMTELVCEEGFKNVRECEGQECTLLFLDRSRGQVRRWCSTASCGNRAKQAAQQGQSTMTTGKDNRRGCV
jgi:predicted RNA-binding Zn ribbon-like protein